MKYPGIKLGRVEAVWNKLGGEEGVSRFLKGDNVKCIEPISIQVGRWLMERGYRPADISDCATKFLSTTNHIGILCGLEKKIDWFLGSIPLKVRRNLIGDISFKEKQWSISVYGNENVSIIEKLASDMMFAFNVKIIVELKQEVSKLESFPEDHTY